MRVAATSSHEAPVAPAGGHRRTRRRFNWLVALKTGLICGVVFFLLPLGSPWSAMSLNSGAVMGRTPTEYGIGHSPLTIPLHFAVALVYAFIVAPASKDPRSWRGILIGGAVGLGLYLLNLTIVTALVPVYAGSELRVAFTHIVFGLLAAACYKGMARPKDEPEPYSG